MIRAVVDYAEGNGSPPPALTKFLRHRTWSVLPLHGGTDDQRYGELERMQAAGRIFDVWQIKKSRPKGWEKYAHYWHDIETFLSKLNGK